MDRSAVAACGLCSTAMVVWMRLVPLLSGLVQVVVGGVFRAWVQTMGLAGRRDLGVALIQYCWASVGSMICKCMWCRLCGSFAAVLVGNEGGRRFVARRPPFGYLPGSRHERNSEFRLIGKP